LPTEAVQLYNGINVRSRAELGSHLGNLQSSADHVTAGKSRKGKDETERKAVEAKEMVRNGMRAGKRAKKGKSGGKFSA